MRWREEDVRQGGKPAKPVCLCRRIVTNSSGDALPQIFDIMKFMSLAADQFRQLPINVKQIQKLSMISFSFAYDTDWEYDTPCWINIINLCALDLLTNKTGLL